MMALCRLEDVPDGAARSFAANGAIPHPFFVVRRGPRVFVYRDDCPHENVPMAWRTNEYLNADRSRIVCFAHGAEFEVESGLCLCGPCVGQHLIREPHSIDPNGWIVI